MTTNLPAHNSSCGCTGLRVVAAPDKFKGTLTGLEAANAIARGVSQADPTAHVLVMPIADGGEGFVDVAITAGATLRSTNVQDPLGRPVLARWALFDDGRAVVESAEASGLALVTATPSTALEAHSFGTGQLIAAALDAGASAITVGVGGTATTDGGSGMLRALGARILDAAGHEVVGGGGALASARRVELSDLDPRLHRTIISIACDVDNPLLGTQGAARMFSRQKGADARAEVDLERGLSVWASLLEDATGVDPGTPGSGAGGGIPISLVAVTDAAVISGFDAASQLMGLPEALATADLVITGEGSLDAQSLHGKGPIALSVLARNAGVDVIVIAGAISVTAEELLAHGVVAGIALVDLAPDSADALNSAGKWVEIAASTAYRRWQAGEHDCLRSADGTPQ